MFESTQSKSRDSVFDNLLGLRTNRDSRRALQVTEAELAFLYDCFFTKYSSINSRSTMVWGVASVVSLLCVVALTVARAAGIFPASNVSVITKATQADNIITVIILGALALLEVLQMVLYWTSNWGRVAFVRQYIWQTESTRRKPSCWMRVKAFLSGVKLFSTRTRRYYWKQQLGQYCLLQSSIGGPNACVGRIERTLNTCCWVLGSLGLPRAFFGMIEAKVVAWHVTVPSCVWQSVVRSLERTGGHLTNGASSLVFHGTDHLLWACSQGIRTSARDKGSQARTILTWHIATHHCKMRLEEDAAAAGVDMPPDAVQVAMALSQYCAYLVVYAPQLLPGHMCDTYCLFHAAAHESNISLQAGTIPDEDTIFGGGAMLGRQLVGRVPDVTRRWTVIADFWSETILYQSTSRPRTTSRGTSSSLPTVANSSPTCGLCYIMLASSGGRTLSRRTQAHHHYSRFNPAALH